MVKVPYQLHYTYYHMKKSRASSMTRVTFQIYKVWTCVTFQIHRVSCINRGLSFATLSKENKLMDIINKSNSISTG